MLFSAPPSTLLGKFSDFSSLFTYFKSFLITSLLKIKHIIYLLCRSRGWARLGAAQLCLGHPTAAASAYAQGLRLDPKNDEMLSGMELAKKAGHARGGHIRRAAMHDTEDA